MDTTFFHRFYSVQFIPFKECMSKDIISAKTMWYYQNPSCYESVQQLELPLMNNQKFDILISKKLHSPLHHLLNVTDSSPQSWKKLVGQIKEIKLNWTGPRTLKSISAYISAAMTKVLLLRGRLGTRLCLQQTFKFHLFNSNSIPGFLRS